MLGVHDLGFPGAVAEEVRVEKVAVGEHSLGLDVAGLSQQGRADARGQQLIVGRDDDALTALLEVRPEGPHVGGAGEPAGRPDDGNLVEVLGSV